MRRVVAAASVVAFAVTGVASSSHAATVGLGPDGRAGPRRHRQRVDGIEYPAQHRGV